MAFGVKISHFMSAHDFPTYFACFYPDLNLTGEDKGNQAADDVPSSSKRKRKEDDATENENTDSATESESVSVTKNSGLVSAARSEASYQSVVEDSTSDDLDYNVADIKTEVDDPDYNTSVPNISDVDVKTEPEEMDYGDDGVMKKSYSEEERAAYPFVANIKTEKSESEETLPAPVPVKVVQNFHSLLQTTQSVEQTTQPCTVEQTPVATKISTSVSKSSSGAKKSKPRATVLNTVSNKSAQKTTKPQTAHSVDSGKKTTKASTVHSGDSENITKVLNAPVVASNPPVQLISGIQPTVLFGNPNQNVVQLLNAIPGGAQLPGGMQFVNTIQPSLQLLNANQNVVQFPTAMPNTGHYFPTMALNQKIAVPPVLAAPAAPVVEHPLIRTKLANRLPSNVRDKGQTTPPATCIRTPLVQVTPSQIRSPDPSTFKLVIPMQQNQSNSSQLPQQIVIPSSTTNTSVVLSQSSSAGVIPISTANLVPSQLATIPSQFTSTAEAVSSQYHPVVQLLQSQVALSSVSDSVQIDKVHSERVGVKIENSGIPIQTMPSSSVTSNMTSKRELDNTREIDELEPKVRKT